MEYNFSACLAYDVSFRKKAARFRLATWGQIDPQLYTRAFTGAGKARPRALCDHCLSPGHSSTDCTLFYPRGPAKRAKVTPAGPRPSTTRPQEVCRNFNRGRCSRDDCPRRHTCLTPGCSAHIQPSRAQTNEPLHANPSLLISHMPSITFHVLPLPPNPPLPLTHALSFTPIPCTPIHHTLLASLLSLHPNPTWVTYLLDGLTRGFRVGYRGGYSARTAPNLRSALARPRVIHQYLAAECEAGHTVGPFPSPPLPAFVVNPLGAVPKKRSGKWRLIMHLSHPPGESVNDGIEVTDFPLRYSTVYDAIDSVMQLGQGAQMAKIDIKSAFRLCPVHPADHHLLGMRWRGRFYFDIVLPFGLRSAPFIFNCLADAIEWIATQHGIHPIHHYLDDFFLAGTPSSPHCLHNLQSLISLCNDLGGFAYGSTVTIRPSYAVLIQALPTVPISWSSYVAYSC